MNTQPEALFLEDNAAKAGAHKIAAELRRLHAANQTQSMDIGHLHTLNQELLEALKGMVEIAELTIGWFPTPPNADGPLIQARAAIAKAEGQQ